MITPEIIKNDCVKLVHNHSLETAFSAQQSLKFIMARIALMRSHVPSSIKYFDVIFDIKGQSPVDNLDQIFSPSSLGVRSVTFLED